MKIKKISAYQVDLPVQNGEFQQSSGRVWRSLDTTIVRIETDSGIIGWGETTPFGANYVPGFAEGARAGIGILAPELIGQNPCEISAINMLMDTNMVGRFGESGG